MASSSHQNNLNPHRGEDNDGDDNNNNPSKNYPPEMGENKKGKGRKKVTMERIENETRRQITFSKRRTGLFKKASELSTLCGAEVGFLAFSPSGKAHSFGSPSVEAITERFLNQNFNPGDMPAIAPPPPTSEHARLQAQVNELEARTEALKKTNNEIRKGVPNLDELDFESLYTLKKSIKELRKKLKTINVQDGMNLHANSNPNPSTGGGGMPPDVIMSLGGGLGSGFSMFGPNMQGSDYMGPPFPGEPLGHLSYPGSSIFPFHRFVDPYDPSVGEHFVVPFPYSSSTGVSNAVFGHDDLFGYGNSGQDMMPLSGRIDDASVWEHGEGSRHGRQRNENNGRDNSKGATKNNRDRASK